jgi:hypothetical protein
MTPSLEIGNGNWAVKSDSLLGYKTINGKYYPREMSVTRATTATRVNASGLVELVPYNLLSWSEEFDNVVWPRVSSNLTVNATISPSGVLNADKLVEIATTSTHRTSQFITITTTATYTSSVYVKASERNRVALCLGDGVSTYGRGFDLSTQTTFALTSGEAAASSWTINSVGNGWFRITITATAAGTTGAMQIRLMDSGTSTNYAGTDGSGLFIWGAQLVEGTQALNYLPTTDRLDIARVDYSLGQANLLLEPQRTNLAVNSVWSGGGVNPTSWNLAGTGGTTTPVSSIKTNLAAAYRFQVNSQRRFFTQFISVTSGVTYSFSVYVESVVDSIEIQQMLNCFALGSPVFTREGVTIPANNLVQAGFRYTLTGVASSTTLIEFRVGGGVGGVDIADVTLSMPQVEAGAFPTSFIPTTSTSVTRNADVISRSNIFTNGYITSAGGTWFVDFRNNRSLVRDASANGLYLTDATALSFGFRIKTYAPNNRLAISKVVSGTETPIYTTLTDTAKVAIKWNGTTADVFVNGVKVVTATAFTSTAMEVIATNVSVPIYLNDTALYTTPLSDTECINLTTI